jgi:hypothetical protein
MMSKRISSQICKSHFIPSAFILDWSDTCSTLFHERFLLIPLSYDAEEASASAHLPVSSAVPSAPVDTSINRPKDEPGYGEEPDMAYDPTSFDVDAIGQDDHMNGTQHVRSEPEVHERPAHTESSGINMKEDG